MSIFDYIFRLGLCIGIAVLNCGIVFWIVADISHNNDANGMANELIRASMLLLVVTLILYLR